MVYMILKQCLIKIVAVYLLFCQLYQCPCGQQRLVVSGNIVHIRLHLFLDESRLCDQRRSFLINPLLHSVEGKTL